MDIRMPARFCAAAILVAALAATAAELRRDSTATIVAGDKSREAGDPLAADLLRCREIGAAAASDPGCETVWAESRRRFLGRSHRVPDASPPLTSPIIMAPIPPGGPSRVEVRPSSGGVSPDTEPPSGREAE